MNVDMCWLMVQIRSGDLDDEIESIMRAAFEWAEIAEQLAQARREGDFVRGIDLERSERELRRALQIAIRAAKEAAT